MVEDNIKVEEIQFAKTGTRKLRGIRMWLKEDYQLYISYISQMSNSNELEEYFEPDLIQTQIFH